MSKKLAIMQALTALLEQTPGYELKGRIYRGRKTVSETDAKESMSILEAPRVQPGSNAGPDGQVNLFNWQLNVQGWPVEDVLNPSDPAYVMVEAVEQMLHRIQAVSAEFGTSGQPIYPDAYRLGGLIASIAIADSIVLPPTQDLSRVAFFYIPVTVAYVRDQR